MSLTDLLRQRSSAHAFTPSHIDTAELMRLVQAACHAPSAYHLQNWHFTAVCSPAARRALQQAAFGQAKIGQAAAVFIISGDLLGYQALAARLQTCVQAGEMSAETASAWVSAAHAAFHAQPQAQRDEAIRSASLAAMPLMLAAVEQGWASCPMSGFDAQAVHRLARLPDSHVPVLLVALGRPAAAQPPKTRVPPEQVFSLI
ncbi:MAG: nitroreductase family protein [Pseudomonadota bacterium]|nr:nitroreductase family protein [Pseudomonadota bacterium]